MALAYVAPSFKKGLLLRLLRWRTDWCPITGWQRCVSFFLMDSRVYKFVICAASRSFDFIVHDVRQVHWRLASVLSSMRHKKSWRWQCHKLAVRSVVGCSNSAIKFSSHNILKSRLSPSAAVEDIIVTDATPICWFITITSNHFKEAEKCGPATFFFCSFDSCVETW